MRLLIDHTTLHALSRSSRNTQHHPDVRGVLQLVEELCLASEVWLSDTEGSGSIKISNTLFDYFVEAELADSQNTGLVRFAKVTQPQFRRVCERAAKRLYDQLYLVGMDNNLVKELRKRAAIRAGRIRPEGIEPRNFPSFLKGITWDSRERESHIASGLDGKDFGSTASLLLLDEYLFRWAVRFTNQVPDPKDAAYEHLNTLCRWHINNELSSLIGSEGGARKHLQYAPAYGRAMALGKTYLPKCLSKLHFLGHPLWDAYIAYKNEKGEALGPPESATGASFPLPLVGAALVLGLPRKPSIKDLLKAIADFRSTAPGEVLRKMVSDAVRVSDTKTFAEKVFQALKVKNVLGSLSIGARWTLSIPFEPMSKVELFAESRLSAPVNLNLLEHLRNLLMRRHQTVFTSFLEPIFQRRQLVSQLTGRVASILSSAYQ